jgi:hypothetical protein
MMSAVRIARTARQTFSQVTLEKSHVTVEICEQRPKTFSQVTLESRTFSHIIVEFSHGL